MFKVEPIKKGLRTDLNRNSDSFPRVFIVSEFCKWVLKTETNFG